MPIAAGTIIAIFPGESTISLKDTRYYPPLPWIGDLIVGIKFMATAGKSINPAIDKGQIEGGFIQGMGWLTTEELHWNDKGRLTTHAPSTYKIPAVNDCPAEFHTRLFAADNLADTVLKSKAVGEPPLLLAFSVYFAIRDAVARAGKNSLSTLSRAPASCEEILRALG